MDYKLVSFYTINTPYQSLVKGFEESLNKFNIPHKIYTRKSTGKWAKNTQFKAEVILEALNEFKCPIIWLDVDALIYKEPTFFNTLKDIDFCCHYLVSDWNRNELLTGTLYFDYNEKVLNMIKEWIELNKTNIQWDQKNLQQIYESNYKDELKFKPLPKEYIKIDRLDRIQGKMGEPVIIHYQASRKYRGKV